ncbi:hypothetical protein [Rheinheimera salexigens]|uniref:Peptidase MA-like domain-containing protein n=1 Tax=Rheinheimera salexigens TaxID=1628148 RepID=A0A1E7Q289_9GAMM|nr:hypothetical protein [Rheinheimera salexigens]OEY68324.1 hypothetical protein BI198_01140 [Rheinheimera salexigens]
MNSSTLILLLAAFTLTACGGGESSSSVSSAPSADNGQFKSSHETGIYYSAIINGNTFDYNFGLNSMLCQSTYRDYYYETDNALIFGNPDLPQEDFQVAAGWVESELNTALTAMNMTKAEFYAARTNVSMTARDRLKQGLSTLNSPGQSYGNFTFPDHLSVFSEWEDVGAWRVSTAQDASLADIAATLIGDSHSGYTSEDQIRLENKIYVCIHEPDHLAGWGEGHLTGINIGANSNIQPFDTAKIIVHELIHTIQHALVANTEGFRVPRWFSEGQAVYLSKMRVADKSKHAEFDPTEVVSFSDEMGDTGLAYQHYGLAYQYVQEANGLDNVKAMMLRVKNDSYKMHASSQHYRENPNYILAFDATMLDMNQQALTVEQYRSNYHSYLSDYAAKP